MMGSMFVSDLSLDHLKTYRSRIESVDMTHAANAVARHLHSDPLLIVIVGDLASIESSIRAMNLGEVVILN